MSEKLRKLAKEDSKLALEQQKIRYAFATQLSDVNLWDAYIALKALLADVRLELASQNPQGFIKKPQFHILPDGADHIVWFELGKEEKDKRYEATHVCWAPNFGHLWKSGWITKEELDKAVRGKRFRWFSSGIVGQGSP